MKRGSGNPPRWRASYGEHVAAAACLCVRAAGSIGGRAAHRCRRGFGFDGAPERSSSRLWTLVLRISRFLLRLWRQH